MAHISVSVILQFEKDELLAKASKDKEDEKDEKKEKFKEQMEQERLERKTHLNAWKVCWLFCVLIKSELLYP